MKKRVISTPSPWLAVEAWAKEHTEFYLNGHWICSQCKKPTSALGALCGGARLSTGTPLIANSGCAYHAMQVYAKAEKARHRREAVKLMANYPGAKFLRELEAQARRGHRGEHPSHGWLPKTLRDLLSHPFWKGSSVEEEQEGKPTIVRHPSGVVVRWYGPK